MDLFVPLTASLAVPLGIGLRHTHLISKFIRKFFQKLPSGRHEYTLVSKTGKEIRTGELIPDGTDPHTATVLRSLLEGKTYGARYIA